MRCPGGQGQQILPSLSFNVFGVFVSQSHSLSADFFQTQFFIQVLPPIGVIEGFSLDKSNESFCFNFTKVSCKNLKSLSLFAASSRISWDGFPPVRTTVSHETEALSTFSLPRSMLRASWEGVGSQNSMLTKQDVFGRVSLSGSKNTAFRIPLQAENVKSHLLCQQFRTSRPDNTNK